MKPPAAIILAAGRGERMRPLTDTVPKPLLKVRGRPLIEWHLDALARAGVHDVVINTAWCEDQFPAALGDGARWNLRIHYSHEQREHGGALETAGGIATALHRLADAADRSMPFWVVSGDIHAPTFTFDPGHVERLRRFPDRLGHLWLVPNPPFHPGGDFGIDADGLGVADATGADGPRWTYANLALLRPALLEGIEPGRRAALGPLLFAAMRERRISVEPWHGEWHNIGTPAQLAELQDAR